MVYAHYGDFVSDATRTSMFSMVLKTITVKLHLPKIYNLNVLQLLLTYNVILSHL